MPIVSITQASKLTGKSVRTLHRHLANGRLSYTITDSGKGIDTSELIRVYDIKMSEMTDTDKNKMASHDTVKTQSKDKVTTSNGKLLEHQIDLLKLELEAEKRLSNERLYTIEAKQETIDTLKSALKLLEHKQSKDEFSQTTPMPPKPEQPLPEPSVTIPTDTVTEAKEPVSPPPSGFWGSFKKLFQ